MDGVPGVGAGKTHPGESTVYEFDAFPFGACLCHCHSNPIKRHIRKVFYGAFIADSDPNKHAGQAREVAKMRNHNHRANASVNEMVMVMNAFDTNLDGDNEIYAVNTVAFAYLNRPMPIRRDQL